MDDLELVLRDGLQVHARRLVAADAGRLQAGLKHLSDASKIQRFHAGMSRLSLGQLRYLTEVDQEHHLAWGVEDPTKPDDPGLGVVRAIGPGEHAATAEFAIAVVDSHQSRGLGALLMGLIALDAHQHGFRKLMGVVRLANQPMLHLLRQLGAVEGRSEDGNQHMILDLDDLASWPDTRQVREIRERLPGWPSAPR